MIDPSLQRKPFVTGLIEVIGRGIEKGCLDDAEAVVACLRVLKPKLAEVDTFDAWIAIRRGRWEDAVRILRDVEGSAGNWQLGKALMAFAQFASGDSGWNITANEVLENGTSKEAIGLVRVLLNKGADDPDERSPDAEPPGSNPLQIMSDPSFVRV